VPYDTHQQMYSAGLRLRHVRIAVFRRLWAERVDGGTV
jgi:hypothetical protein